MKINFFLFFIFIFFFFFKQKTAYEIGTGDWSSDVCLPISFDRFNADVHDLGNPEIAEIMNISVEAVESLIARGKRALTTDLAAQRDELGISE